jgi:diguanylate cyclase (GGDEF)-like protein
VQRFMHAIGADVALLASGRGDAPRVYTLSRSRRQGDGQSPFRGAVLGALERLQAPELQTVEGFDLVLAPVAEPGGVPAMLAAAVPEGTGDRAWLLWLARGYAATLALCLNDPDGLGRALARITEDPLTGCRTREAVRERLDEEVARAQRHDRTLACLYVGMDRFASVNQRWGYLMGDEVLAAAGAAMRRCMRGADTIGRMGGVEFVVVMPETSARRAQALGSRMDLAVRDATRALIGQEVATSAGVASWRSSDTPRDLLERARALSLARRGAADRAAGTALPLP